MWIFYILLLGPIIIQHFAIKSYQIDIEKKNKYAITFFFVLLTILVMFRHESVGNDTKHYIYYFEHFSNLPWGEVANESLEDGFSYLNKIISIFTKEPRVYLAVVAILVSSMIYPTYKRLCVDSSLTIVLFSIMSTFVMMFSGIRQMLAIGLGVIAYEFVRNKKIVPFILVVALAMTIHTSAFMLVIMYPVYHARITKKMLLVIVPAIAAVFVFNQQIFSALSLFVERYTDYETTIAKTGAYTMVILFAAFAVFAFLIPDESHLDDETIGLRNFMLFALTLQMFAPLHSLAMRMNYYYIIFIPLLIPKIVQYRQVRWSKVAVAGRNVMVAFFLLYFFVNANGGESLDLFPYHFFWEVVR